MSVDNAFEKWHTLGYKRLLPIMPPHAVVSPGSHGDPGKTPGIANGAGWHGIKDWQHYHAAEIELHRWGAMGASVGLLATPDAFALDVDAHNPEISAQIEVLALAMLGNAPKRVGREPKFALLYRTDSPLRPQVLRFEGPPEREGKPDRVEIPTQLVIDGMHPGTKRPYAWVRAPGTARELSCVTADQLQSFFEVLRGVLPITASLLAGVDRQDVEQGALRGAPDEIARAIRATPNHSSLFRYEEWVRIAAAIRGALPDDQEFGAELFREFSERTDIAERTEDPDRVYWSVQAPFGVGAAYLLNLATRTSDFAAERWFEAPAPESTIELKARPEGLYEVLSVHQLLNRPPQRFLLAGHIPENSLGFLYGDPGTGKSFIALDWALHMAAAREAWHDIKLTEPGAVAYIAGEGVSGMGSRIKAWLTAHGGSIDDSRFGLLHETINFMNVADVGKLAATLRHRMPGSLSLIVVDTISRAMPGADENLQKEMTMFVAACDALRQSFNCAVLGVHHASKGGDMRGSTVLRGAGDFVFNLKRKKGHLTGTLWCDKQKDAPDGWCAEYDFSAAHGSIVVGKHVEQKDEKTESPTLLHRQHTPVEAVELELLT